MARFRIASRNRLGADDDHERPGSGLAPAGSGEEPLPDVHRAASQNIVASAAKSPVLVRTPWSSPSAKGRIDVHKTLLHNSLCGFEVHLISREGLLLFE